MPAYLVILCREFSTRQAQQPGFSLRTFATQLEVDVGHLSRLFAQKRALRPHTAIKLAEKLHLEGQERTDFLRSALGEQPEQQQH